MTPEPWPLPTVMPTTAGMTVLVTSSTRCSIALSSLIDSGDAEIGLADAVSVSGLERFGAGLGVPLVPSPAESATFTRAGFVAGASDFAAGVVEGFVLGPSARNTWGTAK